MNSRERILAAINHQPVDRVPTDIWATPEVMDKLRARFGSDEDVRQALHIDGIADIRPAYIGLTKFVPKCATALTHWPATTPATSWRHATTCNRSPQSKTSSPCTTKRGYMGNNQPSAQAGVIHSIENFEEHASKMSRVEEF
jgi:hypothetical protein